MNTTVKKAVVKYSKQASKYMSQQLPVGFSLAC